MMNLSSRSGPADVARLTLFPICQSSAAPVSAQDDWTGRCDILWFNPTPREVHRKTAEWFRDTDVYRFIGSYLPHIPQLSMRYYDKGRRLREAGFQDWQKSLLQMMLPDRLAAVVAGLQLDPRWKTEAQRIDQFIAETGSSESTYYRTKKKLPLPTDPPPNVLRGAPTLRLVGDDS